MNMDVTSVGRVDRSAARQQPATPVYATDHDAEGVRRALAQASGERARRPGVWGKRRRSESRSTRKSDWTPTNSSCATRMFTRKAVRKAMKSAKKSMGTKKGKQNGGHKERPKKRGAKNKKVID